MGLAWWICVVVGLGLLVVELMTVSFVLLWLGVAALIVGLGTALFEMSLTAQLLAWSVLSIAMTWLWFAVLKKRWMPTRTLMGQADPGVIGEIGLVTADIHPYARGRVRFQRPIFGSDLWECLADEDIAMGSRVRIVSIEGNFFKVTLVNPSKSEESHG